MRSFQWVHVVGLLLTLVIAGCLGSENPVSPDKPDTQNPVISLNSASDSHQLWGYYEWIIDPEANSIEIVPLRHSMLHVNVLKLLESGVPKLGIKNLEIIDDMIEVDVILTHPFNGLNQYTGFDVRGIFITPASVAGYSEPWIEHSSPMDTYLTNADGWTRRWNPTEFPVGENIFNYRDGNLGAKYNGSNLNSTLNAYKYFCDDLDFDDGLDTLEQNHRGMFQAGFDNERHYSIHFINTSPLVFNYAVDASWDLPDPDPPVFVPDDFPMIANAPEAYRIETETSENTLYYMDNNNKGGQASLSIYVYDWQGCADTSVTVQQMEGIGADLGAAVGGNEQFSTYQFDFNGQDLVSYEPLDLLISAISNDALFGIGDASAENVSTSIFKTLSIEANPPAPAISLIDPDMGTIGESVPDVVVYGSDFATNAEVKLIDDATGLIEINATAEIVSGGMEITCDFDLSDPSVETGLYDVRVTNPDTGLWGELDKGFTVKGTDHPWPSWRGGDLNQAASEYVGYGSSTDSGTPKWIYDTTGYGNITAGCVIDRDGIIYFNTGGSSPSGPDPTMHAVNPDGTEKWTATFQTVWVSLCPAIDNEGYLYSCFGTPSANYLYKIDPTDGSAVWSCYLSGTPCYASAPSVGLDGAVYVTFSTAFSAGYIQRVEPDGTLGWNYWIPSSAYSYTWQLGTAILENGNIIATGGTHGRIICFEPDGNVLWEYQFTSWILHTPSVGPEGNIYFSTWSDPGHLVCINSDGEFQWEYESGFYIWASPCVDPVTGNIFWGDRLGHFRCFDSNGNVLWDQPFASTGIDGSAAVDANGDVYVAVGHQPSAPFRGLVKMDGENGNIIWQSDDIGYMITTSPSIGADGTLYLTGYDASHALFAWGY